MIQNEVIDILKRNQLSITDSRKSILQQFVQSKVALAHHELERNTSEKIDRVTIYRTIQTFMDKGILHTIPTADNTIRYALCKEECSEGHHHDDHVHFVCERCGITTCLDETAIPSIPLPKGYKSTQVNILVNGICKSCR
ncbi:MAG: Fur family transcriptional regulator [Chitinophagaceae bacterium]